MDVGCIISAELTLVVDDYSKTEIFVHNDFSNILPPLFDNYFDSFDQHYETQSK